MGTSDQLIKNLRAAQGEGAQYFAYLAAGRIEDLDAELDSTQTQARKRIESLKAELYEAKNLLADFVSDLEDGDDLGICYRCVSQVVLAEDHERDCPVRLASEFIYKKDDEGDR